MDFIDDLAIHTDDLAFHIGTRISKLRQSAGLSRAELASRAGVSRAHLANIELGKTSATIKILKNLADALDAPLSMVLPTEHADPEQYRNVQIQILMEKLQKATPEILEALNTLLLILPSSGSPSGNSKTA